MSHDIKRILALCGMTREQVEWATKDMRPSYPIKPVDQPLVQFMENWLHKWSSCHENAMMHMTMEPRPALVAAVKESPHLDFQDITRDKVVHRFYYYKKGLNNETTTH